MPTDTAERDIQSRHPDDTMDQPYSNPDRTAQERTPFGSNPTRSETRLDFARKHKHKDRSKKRSKNTQQPAIHEKEQTNKENRDAKGVPDTKSRLYLLPLERQSRKRR